MARVKSNSIPTLAEASETYAEIQAKDVELGARYETLRARMIELVDKNGGRLPPEQVQPKQATSPAVARLLGAYAPPSPMPAGVPADDPRAIYDAVCDEMEAIKQARAVLLNRKRKERLQASDEICKRLAPTYEALARNIATAAAALSSALDEHEAFVSELQGKDIAFAALDVLGGNGVSDRLREAVDDLIREAGERSASARPQLLARLAG